MTLALHLKRCAATEVIRKGSQHSFSYWPSVKGAIISFVAAN